jgi:hypothetical protein
MNPELRESFWAAVRECLIHFHRVPPSEAAGKVSSLRQRLAEAPAGSLSDMIYHAEPFDVACDLAGEPLDRTKFAGEYEEILDRYFVPEHVRATSG